MAQLYITSVCLTVKLNCFFEHWTEMSACLPWMMTPGLNFINVLHTAFILVNPKSVKNTVKSYVYFYAFGICERKRCTLNVDEIEP